MLVPSNFDVESDTQHFVAVSFEDALARVLQSKIIVVPNGNTDTPEAKEKIFAGLRVQNPVATPMCVTPGNKGDSGTNPKNIRSVLPCLPGHVDEIRNGLAGCSVNMKLQNGPSVLLYPVGGITSGSPLTFMTIAEEEALAKNVSGAVAGEGIPPPLPGWGLPHDENFGRNLEEAVKKGSSIIPNNFCATLGYHNGSITDDTAIKAIRVDASSDPSGMAGGLGFKAMFKEVKEPSGKSPATPAASKVPVPGAGYDFLIRDNEGDDDDNKISETPSSASQEKKVLEAVVPYYGGTTSYMRFPILRGINTSWRITIGGKIYSLLLTHKVMNPQEVAMVKVQFRVKQLDPNLESHIVGFIPAVTITSSSVQFSPSLSRSGDASPITIPGDEFPGDMKKSLLKDSHFSKKSPAPPTSFAQPWVPGNSPHSASAKGSGEVIKACEYCDRHFPNESTLTAHGLSQSGKNGHPDVIGAHRCGVLGCGASFPKESLLTAHEVSQSGENGHPEVIGAHRCGVLGCDASFPFLSLLTEHEVFQSGKNGHPEVIGAHRCGVLGCGASFPILSLLTAHEVFQRGKNGHPVIKGKHACSVENCDASFPFLSGLKKHGVSKSGKNGHPVVADVE